MDRKKRNPLTVLLVIGLLAGIGLLLYPTVANYWNSFHQSRAIMAYTENVDAMDPEDYDRMIREAEEYNADLAKSGMRWHMTEEQQARYESLLDVGGTGIMGYISIPKFHIRLPIYHGTAEEVLQVAIGHLEASSLPVGGENTHTLISGHRGLPSAKLFTDIDKIREGDTWTITVLNETLTYECDQIRIVEPEDLSDLAIEEGKDLCTLITCTPYGINTQRLLVRGHRVPNADGAADITADGIRIPPLYIAPVLAAPALLILGAVLLISAGRAKRRNNEAVKREYLDRIGDRRNVHEDL